MEGKILKLLVCRPNHRVVAAEVTKSWSSDHPSFVFSMSISDMLLDISNPMSLKISTAVLSTILQASV